MAQDHDLHIVIIVGEHSGDQLGAKLVPELRKLAGENVKISGIAGPEMERLGVQSIFPMAEVAVMGVVDILKRLRPIIRRVHEAVDYVVREQPDVLVIIDSPEFSHPIAKRVRKKSPHIPIIDYVSPTVWAWRPGRAKKMRRYIDHVLALLPFEPAAHKRLGGPPCSYVGHPLIERLNDIKSVEVEKTLPPELFANQAAPDQRAKRLVVLPGSRPNEVKRLMQPFAETLAYLKEDIGPLEVIIPVVSSVRHLVEDGLAGWPLRPLLLEGEENKFAAFKWADAALAASGTVTLELALAQVPMVVAYKVDALTAQLRWVIKVDTVVLANHVLGENIFPEYLQHFCVPEDMAAALKPLLIGGPERDVQLDALARVDKKMMLDEGTPSMAAAKIILQHVNLSE